jgi:hypothetical protein
MLSVQTKVLVIAQVMHEGKMVTVNDYSTSLDEWIAKHPAHVALQIVELENSLFNKIKGILDIRKNGAAKPTPAKSSTVVADVKKK